MRLDKYLVDCGVGSRTEVKQVLKQKKIQVNGKVETSAKVHIDPDKDQVTYLGESLFHEEFVYYLLNKPKGVISAKMCIRDRSSDSYSDRRSRCPLLDVDGGLLWDGDQVCRRFVGHSLPDQG